MNQSSLYEMKHSIVQVVSDYVELEGEDMVEVNVTMDEQMGTIYSVAMPVTRRQAPGTARSGALAGSSGSLSSDLAEKVPRCRRQHCMRRALAVACQTLCLAWSCAELGSSWTAGARGPGGGRGSAGCPRRPGWHLHGVGPGERGRELRPLGALPLRLLNPACGAQPWLGGCRRLQDTSAGGCRSLAECVHSCCGQHGGVQWPVCAALYSMVACCGRPGGRRCEMLSCVQVSCLQQRNQRQGAHTTHTRRVSSCRYKLCKLISRTAHTCAPPSARVSQGCQCRPPRPPPL